MEVIEQLAAVAGVLGLLLGCLWWLRRRNLVTGTARRRGERRLELLERLPLGSQHCLHLVRLGEAELLVASSPAGCVLVERLGAGGLPEPRQAAR